MRIANAIKGTDHMTVRMTALRAAIRSQFGFRPSTIEAGTRHSETHGDSVPDSRFWHPTDSDLDDFLDLRTLAVRPGMVLDLYVGDLDGLWGNLELRILENGEVSLTENSTIPWGSLSI